jgi:hypothetical protein
MTTVSTSPYENQEETAPIPIKKPVNPLNEFRYGRLNAQDTLLQLADRHVFEPPLLTGALLAMSYGEEMLSLRETVHGAPDRFREFFCNAIEHAVNAGDITAEGGGLFLALFDGEPVE